MSPGDYHQESKLIQWEKLRELDEVKIGEHPTLT